MDDGGLTDIDHANGLNHFNAARDISPFAVVRPMGTEHALDDQEIGKRVVGPDHLEPFAFELINHNGQQGVVAAGAEKFRQHRRTAPVEP